MRDFITKLTGPVQLGIFIILTTALLAGCASQNGANIKSAEDARRITDIVTSENIDATIVTVKGDGRLIYTAIKQAFPRGVLFHFPATVLDNIKPVYYPTQNDAVSSIRATQIEENEQTARIFIALKKDLPYDISVDESGLHIVFPKTAPAAAETASQTTANEKAVDKPQPQQKPATGPATRITAVTATVLKSSVVIKVKANGTITKYKSFTISETPARIVYDLYGLKSPFKGEQRIAVKSDKVSRVRHFGHPDKVRVVLETQKKYLTKYSASPVDNGLLIHVGAAAPAATKKVGTPRAQASAVKPAPKKIPADQTKATVKKPKTTAVKYSRSAWLNRIDFSAEEAGKSAVIIGTTRPVEYEIVKIGPKRLQLKLADTNLPEYRKRALITTRFQSAVDRITPVLEPTAKQTVIDIELRQAVPYFVKQTDNVIRLNFSPSSIPPRPYEDAKLPAWKQVLAEPSAAAGGTAGAGSEKITAPGKLSFQVAGQRKPAGKALKSAKKELSLEERLAGISAGPKYTGEKIALDFYDTDIKNVFRILREISGKNFAIDKNVTGKVTLTLEKPVPWDQVLDLVLKMNGLGVTMEGDIVRIATLTTLTQEEKLKQAKFKAEQQAIAQQKALEPLMTAYIPVNYSNAQSEVLPHVNQILTPSRGKASVDTRNNQLIVTDTAEKIKQIKEVVFEIDKVTPQVIIEARIVEANASFTRDLGFDWGTITIGPINNVFGDGTDLTFDLLASNLPAADPSAVAGFTFQKLAGTPFSIVDAKLEASESEGKTNIISSPKVVTLDNKKARIKQGLEVPYLERDSSGNATTSFKNVDLLLEVTPNVTPDHRISLKIFITKNDIAQMTAAGPALTTNEAETELLVDDGDTIVIGGIVKSTISKDEKGIPGLRRVGVMGWLFKSNSDTDTKNELLIFITPRIVTLEQRTNI